MINDLVFVQKPTSAKLLCVYEPPDYLRGQCDQLGQLAFALGERPAGAIQIYDGHATAREPEILPLSRPSQATDTHTPLPALSWSLVRSVVRQHDG